MLTSNDVVFGAECSNILSFKNRVSEYSSLLVKLNVDPGLVISSPDVFFSVIKYLTIQESLSKIDTPIAKLEKYFNIAVWKYLPQTDENIKRAARTWVHFHEIYKVYTRMIEESDRFAANMEFYKALYRKKRLSVLSTIDLLLVKGRKVHLVTFSPYRARSISSHILSNIDTLLCIDYLLEGDINLDMITEIGLPMNGNDRGHLVNTISLDEYVKQFVTKCINGLADPSVNIGHCPICPYKKHCNFKDLLYGRNSE